MNKVSILLLSVFAILGAFTQDAGIPITRRGNQVYVDATFGPQNQQRGPLLLGLHQSVTILTDHCLGFSHYPWETHGIAKTTTGNTFLLPFLDVQGLLISGTVVVDPHHLLIPERSRAFTFLTTNCNTRGLPHYGFGAQGIIGLGVEGDQRLKFVGSPVFSIFLKRNRQGGNLHFSLDLNRFAGNHNPVATLVSDANWRVSGVSAVQIGASRLSLAAQHNLIFDLNSDSIGLPINIYKDVLNILSKINVACPPVFLHATCRFAGKIRDLPPIVITVGSQQVAIPAEVYLRDAEPAQGTVQLNLRALDPNMQGENYISQSWANYIVLDVNFMTYYYTSFQFQSGNTITLYTANH